jgi:ketosteroid isomerase-like protein
VVRATLLAVSDELMQRIDEFQRCIEQRDQTAAGRVLDEEFALVLVQPSLAAMPRERWLDVLPNYLVHDYEVQERTVDIDGDCAAVLQRARMKATVLGEDRSGVFVISDVWRRRNEQWRLWRRHSTPLAAGPMPGGSPQARVSGAR